MAYLQDLSVESVVSLNFFLAQISQYSLLKRLTKVNQKTSEVIQHKNQKKNHYNLLCIKHQQLLKRRFKLREQFQAKTHYDQNFQISSTNYEILFIFKK